MLRRTAIAGIHERHGLQVIASTDCGLGACFDGDEQLCHCPCEGVREPTLLPRWTMELAIPSRRITNHRRGRIRVKAPADVAYRQAIQPLDPPLDPNIRWRAFFGRARPGVVDTDATQAIRIFKD